MTSSCLFRNVGEGMFVDQTARSGIAAVMRRHTGWGCTLADFDLDGRLDLYISTGHVRHLEPERDVLFLGTVDGRFTEVTERAGPGMSEEHVARGVARGDFDNDGDVDLLINNLNDHPSLLRNDTPRRGRHWLSVRLVGRPPNHDAIGAVVKITIGDQTQARPRLSGGSYLSQHDPRLHFGLGTHNNVDRLEVVWPDGSQQVMTDVPGDRFLVVRQPANETGETQETHALPPVQGAGPSTRRK
jgi:hypothetical protein